MIFQHTIFWVLNGTKTQTRRLAKPGEVLYHCGVAYVVSAYGTVKWEVGNTYSVQPLRGQNGVARIRILSIRLEDVRKISDEDAKAEGFRDRYHFMQTWVTMHDRSFEIDFYEGEFAASLYARPDDRYEAWALQFELVAS